MKVKIAMTNMHQRGNWLRASKRYLNKSTKNTCIKNIPYDLSAISLNILEIVSFLHSIFLRSKKIPKEETTKLVESNCQVISISAVVFASSLIKKYPNIVTPLPTKYIVSILKYINYFLLNVI